MPSLRSFLDPGGGGRKDSERQAWVKRKSKKGKHTDMPTGFGDPGMQDPIAQMPGGFMPPGMQTALGPGHPQMHPGMFGGMPSGMTGNPLKQALMAKMASQGMMPGMGMHPGMGMQQGIGMPGMPGGGMMGRNMPGGMGPGGPMMGGMPGMPLGAAQQAMPDPRGIGPAQNDQDSDG